MKTTREVRVEEEAEVEEGEVVEEEEEEELGRWMNGRRYLPQPYRVRNMH